LPSHEEEPAGSWTTIAFGGLALSTLVATGVIILRVGRGFVMVADDPAFPRGNPALSFDLAFYRPWSAFRTPETCRSCLDCDQCAFYRVGRRFAWTTDDSPGENWHDLCAVFSTRAFDLLLSVSLLERMIPGRMTLVIKIFVEKGVWQVSTAGCLVFG